MTTEQWFLLSISQLCVTLQILLCCCSCCSLLKPPGDGQCCWSNVTVTRWCQRFMLHKQRWMLTSLDVSQRSTLSLRCWMGLRSGLQIHTGKLGLYGRGFETGERRTQTVLTELELLTKREVWTDCLCMNLLNQEGSGSAEVSRWDQLGPVVTSDSSS